MGSPRVGRFGVIGLAFIFGLGLVSVLTIIVGYLRVAGNEEGGGTLFIGGLLLLLVDLAVVVGLSTTRVIRIDKKYHRLQGMVGEVGVVKQMIPAGGRGVALFRNELWTATSSKELLPGAQVKIVKIEGILLYVAGE